MNNEDFIVLITGGAGFLGQHIVREIQLRQPNVSEIRVLDIKPYINCLDRQHIREEQKPVTSIVGNILDRQAIQHAFNGVTCVIHCAACVSYIFPPNKEKLYKNNIEGTENIISLCQEFDVPTLVFTSTAEVAIVPYLDTVWPCITVIINQTESKAQPPTSTQGFTIPGYAASKFEAERMVLAANGSLTKRGLKLKTVALRPPFTYGEEDPNFITSMVRVAHKLGGKIPQIAGPGGKQQIIYAGNVAWSHICAMNTLMKESEGISGKPVFITDDTPIADTTRLCERLTKPQHSKSPLCQQTWWSIPLVLSMLLALLVQPVFMLAGVRLPISPRALVSYLGSFILFSRLRASIHMGYAPVYSEDEAVKRSAKFYVKYYKTLDAADYITDNKADLI